jgi:hypothetical protein
MSTTFLRRHLTLIWNGRKVCDAQCSVSVAHMFVHCHFRSNFVRCEADLPTLDEILGQTGSLKGAWSDDTGRAEYRLEVV